MFTGRRVQWRPLVWAGLAYTVYFLLLRSKGYIHAPVFLEELTLNWVGKVLSIAGTIVMIYLLPNVSFQTVGATWNQKQGSMRVMLLVSGITIISMIITILVISSTTSTSLENVLFQATLPGIDEELFMRGLLLLLFHQAFGKGLNIFGADTSWGFWLVVIIFSLLHGVTIQGGEFSINVLAIIVTGYVGVMLTWMREYSGSLVIPILFHNVVNVTQAFL